MEFNSYPKIERIGKLFMQITQKIHGTNAQVCIQKIGDGFVVKAGSRTRWITPQDDNYGFAKFVDENSVELIEKLGEGTHFGEWAGPGINSGEGLSERTFILFDFWKYSDDLPKQVRKVPVLYQGPLSMEAIEQFSELLKKNGSYLNPDFKRIEGIVINVGGTRYKKVFEANETKWAKGDPNYSAEKIQKQQAELELQAKYLYLLQPIRLEKLLSRDEKYIREYPKSIVKICDDYFQDLVDEKELTDDPDTVLKYLKPNLFKFVRQSMEQK